jgi:hypothetical protein
VKGEERSKTADAEHHGREKEIQQIIEILTIRGCTAKRQRTSCE